jgi:hypothetical protein
VPAKLSRTCRLLPLHQGQDRASVGIGRPLHALLIALLINCQLTPMESIVSYPSTCSGSSISQGFDWLGIIGEGTQSIVHKVRVRQGPHSGELLAVKEINLERLSDKKVKSIMVDWSNQETNGGAKQHYTRKPA